MTTQTVSYYWPNAAGHSVSLTPWKNGLLLPRAQNPVAYNLVYGASDLVPQSVVVENMNGIGFVGAVADVSGNAWLLGYYGDVSYIPGVGTEVAYSIPSATSGDIFAGAAYLSVSGIPYFVSANGDLFTVSGASIVQVTPGFGERVSSLTADTGKLYAALPDSSNLGTYTFTSQTTGIVSKTTTPMSVPKSVAANVSGMVAVGGFTNSTLVSGASNFSMNPGGTMVVAANAPANKVLIVTGTEPDWAITAAVSGTGAPAYASFASSGEQVLVADPTNGKLEVFNVQSGSLVLAQTLTITDASSITVTPDGLTAFVCQPTQNQISVLVNSVNVWSVSQTLTGISQASVVVVLSPTSAVVAGNGLLKWLIGNAGVWSEGVFALFSYVASGIDTDGAGNIFVCGNSGGSGYLGVYTQSGGQITTLNWSGNASAIHYEQGQIAIADATNSNVRIYQYLASTLSLQKTIAGPTGVDAFGYTNPSVWLCGASGMWQYVYTAPFTLAPRRAGVLAIYRGGSWYNYQLQVGHNPTAAAWDVSGTVWVSTLQNDLDHFDTSANLLSSTTMIPDSIGAGNVYPSLGISSMVWWNDGLWAASAQNDAVLLVSGVTPPPVGGATPPSAPKNVQVTIITGNSVTLSWVASTDGSLPIRYQVQYRVTGQSTWIPFSLPTTGVEEIVTGLSTSTSYDFQVVATNLGGSAASSTVTAVTSSLPTAPANLAAKNITTTSMTVSWTASSGTTPIQYTISYNSGGPTLVEKTSATSVSLFGLTPGTTYTISATATNSVGTSPISTLVAATASAAIAPSAPTGLAASNLTNSSLNLSWNASTTGTPTITYQVQYKLHTNTAWTIAGTTLALSFVVRGLTPGATYDFQVLAVNSTGSAASTLLTVTMLLFTSFDPAFGLNMSLTNSDLTATASASSAGGVRSTSTKSSVFGLSSGNIYLEFTTTKFVSGSAVGLATSTWSPTVALGQGANSSLGFTASGAVYRDSILQETAGVWVSGGVVGLAIDFTNKVLWSRIGGGPWFPRAVPSVSGTQNSGATNPVVSGPASMVDVTSTIMSSLGLTVSATDWPMPGTGVLNVSCTSGTVNITNQNTGSSSLTGAGTNSLQYTDTTDGMIAAIQTITYTAPATAGTDTLSVQVWSPGGENNQINIPVTIDTASDPVAGTGGLSFSAWSSFTFYFAYSDAVSGNSVTVNCGESAFAFAAPSGYAAWDAATAGGGTMPNAPGTPTLSSITSASVTLTWTASTVGTVPITYQPRYQKVGDTSWTPFQSPISGTTVTVTGLSPNTAYNFSVQAINTYGVATSGSSSATTANSSAVIGATVGSQSSAGTDPLVTGPASGQVMASQVLAVPATVTDAAWPVPGSGVINVTCTTGTVSLTPQPGGTYTGGGTASLQYQDTTDNMQIAIQTVTYTAPGAAGSDNVVFDVWSPGGSAGNDITVPMTVAATTSGAPSTPTLNITSVSPNSVSLSWTVPSLGTAPLNYAVRYKKAGTSSWNTFATTTGTTMTVTSLASSTAYSFEIQVSNSIGINYSNVLTTNTSSTSTLPGDPSGIQAVRIADVLESFGTNVFDDGQDGSGAAGANTVPVTVQAFKYLTANTGMGLTCRVYQTGGGQVAFCTGISAQMPNVKWGIAATGSDIAALQSETDALVTAGCCAWAEGDNEPQLTNVLTASQTLAIDQANWSRYHPEGVLVVPASLADTGSNTYAQDFFGSSLSTDEVSCDYWNGHDYPNAGAPSHDMWRRTGYFTSVGYGVSGIISEFHPLLYNNKGTDDTLAAYYTACALLGGFKFYNVKALQWFSIYDYTGFNPHVGLFANFDPTQPYPAAKIIHNFFALCTDAAANRRTFAPNELDVTISGLPAAWSGWGSIFSGGGQYLLCQGSNGTFYLFLWNEQDTLAPGTTTPVRITFNSVPMTQVVDYSITNPITDTPTPVQTLTHVNNVLVELTTEVRVLVITHP